MVSFQTLYRKLNTRKQKGRGVEQASESLSYISTRGVICPYCKYEHDDSIQQSGVALCGNCGQSFKVEVKREKTGKIIKREHEEFIKTFTTQPVTVAPKSDIDKIKSVDQLTQLINTGQLTVEQARDITTKRGWDMTFWNLSKERNPFNPEGDNLSREQGFSYNCHKHPKGKYFQWVIKPAILRFIDVLYGTARALYGKDRANWFKRQVLKLLLLMAPSLIEFANKSMVTQYDKDAFVFDDPETQALRKFMVEQIKENFLHDYPRKAIFMLKCVDMFLVVDKEDIFYRARRKKFFNALIKQFPDGFALTEAEKNNIESANTEAVRLIKEKGQVVDIFE